MPCCGALLWRLEGLGNQPFIHSVTVAFYPFDVGSYTLQTLLYSKLAGALVNVWSSKETRHLKAKMKSQFSRCCCILNCSRRSDCGYCAKRGEKEKQPCFRVFFFFPRSHISYCTPLYECLEQARGILAQLFQVFIYLYLFAFVTNNAQKNMNFIYTRISE